MTRKTSKNEKRRYALSEYTNSEAEEDVHDARIRGAYSTNLEDLKLNIKVNLYYLFDFGDSWWHEITVLSINDLNIGANKGYPKIMKKAGKSPPQYDFDENEY